jgi:Mn-dependent DtxR family transcriptional regulator
MPENRTMPENRNLTSTQEAALAAYGKLSEQKGEPPTVRELAAVLGKSHQAAWQLIQQLRTKGYLSMKPVTIIRPTLTKKGRAAR